MFRKLSGTSCNRRLNDSISIEALSSLPLRSPKNFNRHVIIHSRNCDRDPVALKESMKCIFAWSMRCAGDSFSDVKHRSMSMYRTRGTIPASSSHEKSCLRTSSCQSANWETIRSSLYLTLAGWKNAPDKLETAGSKDLDECRGRLDDWGIVSDCLICFRGSSKQSVSVPTGSASRDSLSSDWKSVRTRGL